MEEQEIQCVGICQVDPETGYCIGCGRRAIDYAPEPASTPAIPQPAPQADPDGGAKA